MAEAIPKIEFVFNNTGGKDLRCLNYQFYLKSLGKQKLVHSPRCRDKLWSDILQNDISQNGTQ